VATVVETERQTQNEPMAQSIKTVLHSESANAWLDTCRPLITVPEETDLTPVRALFELLAEWESKEANEANRNQS